MFELEGLVAVSGGCSLAAVLTLPIPMASLVAEALGHASFRSCGTWDWELWL